MRAPRPGPPRDGTTIWHVTDTHVNYTTATAPWGRPRLDEIAKDLNDVPSRFAIGGRVLTGDITEHGRSDQISIAMPWLTSNMGDPTKDVWVYGNHDYGNGWVSDTKDRATVESLYGRSALSATYMGPAGAQVRILGIGPDTFPTTGGPWTMTQATIDWMNARLTEDSTTPTFIACHYSLAQTEPTADIAALFSAFANLVGWICGHAHFPVTEPRSVMTVAVGNRTALPHYCGPSTTLLLGSPYEQTSQNPYRSFFITYVDETRQEARFRDHGARLWIAGSDQKELVRVLEAA